MPELMASADVAISAAGSTCWELCFLGVPSLIIDIAPNQTPIARALDSGGYAIYAGEGLYLSPDKLSDQFHEMATSQELRRRLSERCKSLVDGRGAHRVIAAMRAQQLTFRRATWSDAELLWIWANDPEVREASLSSNPIGWQEHQVWFGARLADSGSLVLIAEEAGDPIGTVRLQSKDATGARISLTVAPGARGVGLAGPLIEEGVDQAASVFGVTEVEALVKPWNQASRKAFENSGFCIGSGPCSGDVHFLRYVRETFQEAVSEPRATASRRPA
jgi:RimJ/RimL family protein N-acetyltransferase